VKGLTSGITFLEYMNIPEGFGNFRGSPQRDMTKQGDPIRELITKGIKNKTQKNKDQNANLLYWWKIVS
jgi:hypothetical protein